LRQPGLAAGSLFVALIFAGGAVCSRLADAPPETPGGGTYLATAKTIAPATDPPEKAILTLSGSPYDVTVATERDRTHYSIVLLNKGEEFDREEYEDSFEAFRLVRAAGERYEPPIDLLRFPMRAGEKPWTWTGQIVNGKPRDAEATIQTSEDRQYVGGAAIGAVRTVVTLRFLAVGGKTAAERKLTFWFAPGKGVFRREFDAVSVREPAP
jgi:hypothetical protein